MLKTLFTLIALLSSGTAVVAQERTDSIEQMVRVFTLLDYELQQCGLLDTNAVSIFANDRLQEAYPEEEGYIVDFPWIHLQADLDEVLKAYVEINGDDMTVGGLRHIRERIAIVPTLTPESEECPYIEREAKDVILYLGEL